MAVCPRTGVNVHYTGLHLLADLYGAVNLNDVEYIKAACEEAAIATGATIISSSFHHFGGEDGVSGIVLLAESHVSTHSWPEFGLATFDIYVCGNCDPTLAVPVLEKRFLPKKCKVSLHHRGIISPIRFRVAQFMKKAKDLIKSLDFRK